MQGPFRGCNRRNLVSGRCYNVSEAKDALARLRLRDATAREKHVAAAELVAHRSQLAEPRDVGLAVHALAKTSYWVSALVLLADVCPRANARSAQISCTTAVGACTRASAWPAALSAFHGLRQRGMELDSQVLAVVMRALDRGNHWAQAIALMQEASSDSVVPDIVVINTAMTACSNASQWREALALFDDSSRSGSGAPLPTAVTFAAAVTACERGGKWRRALDVLTSMGRAQVQPDTVVFAATMSACARSQQWISALRLLSSGCAAGWSRNIVVYNAAALACERAQEWEHALAVLSNAQADGLALDEVGVNSCIAALGVASLWVRALGMLRGLEAMPRREPSEVTYSAAMQACHAASEWVQALSLFSELLGRAPSSTSMGNGHGSVPSVPRGRAPSAGRNPNVVTTSVAISACGAGAQWQLALHLFRGLQADDRRAPDATAYRLTLLALAQGEQNELAKAIWMEALATGQAETP